MIVCKRCRVRDISKSGQRHSYKALLTYSAGTSGVTLAISFPFKIYGFYFSKLYPVSGTNQFLEENSYNPLDENGIKIKNAIENAIHKNFKNFNPFNAEYANIKIEKIVIDGIKWDNLDLWKAFFTTDAFGII